MGTVKVMPHPDPSRWEDGDLKRLSQENRRMAVELVVRKYRSKLYYHALCIVRDPQEAYDAVQEVFIKAMREPRFFTPDFMMKAWLFRVTSNLCFNIVRDKKRRGGLLTVRHDEAAPQLPPQSATDRVLETQVRDEMLAALEHLTPAHREILLLRYYNDLSYNEIAEVLQVKLGTVMSRLSRARTRLAGVIGPEHPLVAEGV
jgi:RNA polymerase sigma-70 factor (ECF subfamily)